MLLCRSVYFGKPDTSRRPPLEPSWFKDDGQFRHMRVTPTFPMQGKKSDLRRMMRGRRRALSAADRAHRSRSLSRRLGSHPFFRNARRIGVYYPNDGEIDLRPIMRWGRGKEFFLPVLPPPGKRRLWFASYEPGQRLVPDRFGIPEPRGRHQVRAEELDLILVPLVAFDQTGGRIGMGGGYYDTSLSFLSRYRRFVPIRVIGAAYEFQQVDIIPRDAWDIPLHGIITEERFIAARM